jgi:hypothetical protein
MHFLQYFSFFSLVDLPINFSFDTFLQVFGGLFDHVFDVLYHLFIDLLVLTGPHQLAYLC